MDITAKKRSLRTLLLIAFIDNLSVGILLPLVPLLITTHGSAYSILPAHYTEAQGYILFGYLMAIYTIMQFISTPILGQLSDRYGRKPILTISLLGTCLAYALFTYGVITRNIGILFIARAFDGITGGNISVAQAAIADITEQKEKSKVYGLFGASLGLGFALGPFIGSFFSNSDLVPWFNASTPFWITALLCLLSVILVFLFLHETHKPSDTKVSFGITKALKQILVAFTFQRSRTLFSAILLWRTGFAFFATFVSVFLIYRFGLQHRDLGLFFLYTGIWLILGQLFTVGFLANKADEEKLVFMSVLGAGAVMLLYLLPKDWMGLLFVVPLFTNFMALSMANIPAIVSKAASSHNQGEYSGMNNSVQALGLTIAPILSGYISAQLTPVSIIAIASALMLVSGIVFWTYSKQSRHLY